MLLVDPELDEALGDGDAPSTGSCSAQESDAALLRPGVEPVPWEPDEDATATINYTSGTTARPKGVQITHRNIWTNAVTFALHAGVTDRDVYLHTLPMFHCNGWGMPFAMAGLGVPQVVIRKIDGADILRRVEQYGVTVMCCAPAVVAAVLEAAATWEGEMPGRDRVRVICAGAPPPSRVIQRVEEELGWEFLQIYGLTETSPLLTVNRRRAEEDELPAEEARPAAVPGRHARRSAAGSRISDTGEVLARSNVVMTGYWQQPDATAGRARGRLVPHRRRRRARRRGLPHDPRPQEGRHHHRRRERVVDRGRGLPVQPPGGRPRSRSSASPTRGGARRSRRSSCSRRARPPPRPSSSRTARRRLAGYKAPTSVEFRDAIPRTATGKVQKFKLREQYWAGRDRMVN